jgi:hypothetical protein
MAAPAGQAWPIQGEATEVAWLLGAPFMVQVIEGSGEEIVHVLGGLAESGEEGRRLLNARWRVEVERPVDTVVAAVSGIPARETFAHLAEALAAASRVVRSEGRIILLTSAAPTLGPGAQLLRQADDATLALAQLHENKPADMAAAFQWAHACQQAGIYILSGLPGEVVEELFATPLEEVSQVQRLVASGESCLFLPDAHKTLAVLRPR